MDAAEMRRLDDPVFSILSRPIEPDRIKARPGQGGKTLSYVEVETVMDRLDEAVGPLGWETEVSLAPDHCHCRLILHLPSGRTVHRDGIGGWPESLPNRPMSDEDRAKSAATDALKRAGVLFGIARYLYDDTNAARPNAAGGHRPSVPPRSQPEPPRQQPRDQRPQVPRSGKALYAWARQQEQEGHEGLLKRINAWASKEGLPARMIDYDAQQVAAAYSTATRMLSAREPAGATASREPGEDDEPY